MKKYKAFTLGYEKSYDEGLITYKEEFTKLGSRQPCIEHPEGYSGGWVWKTKGEAEQFKKLHLEKHLSTKTPEDFAIYELEIPNKFDKISYKKSSRPHESFLLIDVKIIKKVE